jgi:hypothetical protein
MSGPGHASIRPVAPGLFVREISKMAEKIFRGAWTLAILFPIAAQADVVFLKNQGTVQNCRVLKEELGRVYLRTPGGQMGIPKEEIIRIEAAKSVFDAFDELRAKLKATDSNATFKLAQWCREGGLREEADDLLKKVIAMKSDHPSARRMLGYLRENGEWHLPPPLSVRITITAAKELQEEVDKQMSIILPTRKDLQVVTDLTDVKNLNALELVIAVDTAARDSVTFYGRETQKPTTVVTVNFKPTSAWTGKVPPSLRVEGSLLTGIPDAKRLGVGDAFTRHAEQIHAFFDKVLQERLVKIEAVLARRNEEKKAQAPPGPAQAAPRPGKK